MNDATFRPSKVYHLASREMFRSVCGRDTRREEFGLTRRSLVNCPDCLRLKRERQTVRTAVVGEGVSVAAVRGDGDCETRG